MTNQEIFDKVAKHLLSQGVQSKDSNDTCVYRGPNGLKCAIGALIPDDKYDAGIEGATSGFLLAVWAGAVGAAAWGLLNDILSSIGISLKEQGELTYSLQRIHDTYDPDEWPSQLTKVATQFNLNGSVVLTHG